MTAIISFYNVETRVEPSKSREREWVVENITCTYVTYGTYSNENELGMTR